MLTSYNDLEALGTDVVTRIDSTILKFEEIKSTREHMNENTIDAEVEDLHEKIRDLSDSISLLKGVVKSYFGNVKYFAGTVLDMMNRSVELYQKYFNLDMSQSIVALPVQFQFNIFSMNNEDDDDITYHQIPSDEVTTVMIRDAIISNTMNAAKWVMHESDNYDYDDIDDLLEHIRDLVNNEFNNFIVESPEDYLYKLSDEFQDFGDLKDTVTKITGLMSAINENCTSLNNQLDILSNKSEYTL